MAEVNAGAVQSFLSWFKSRLGLQTSSQFTNLKRDAPACSALACFLRDRRKPATARFRFSLPAMPAPMMQAAAMPITVMPVA